MARPAVKKGRMETEAIRLFATGGLARTTVRDIAEAAEVGEGALYRHWAGKNEMAWDLYCTRTAEFTLKFEPVLTEAGRPLGERLERSVRFVYQYYKDRPDELVFILLTRQSFPAEHILDEAVDPDEAIIRFLTSEIEAGSIAKSDVTLLMAMVRGLVIEPIYMHRYGRLKAHPLSRVEPVAGALIRLLGGRA